MNSVKGMTWATRSADECPCSSGGDAVFTIDTFSTCVDGAGVAWSFAADLVDEPLVAIPIRDVDGVVVVSFVIVFPFARRTLNTSFKVGFVIRVGVV
jgi:hypothetical protein